jgi:hypothetical protein
MRKEDIYVEINDNEDLRLATVILNKNGEEFYDLYYNNDFRYLKCSETNNKWYISDLENLTKISLFELDVLLSPKSTDKLIEEFKQQMRDKGLEVSVVIEREIINPDDVVMYWYEGCVDRVFVRYKDFFSAADNIVKVTDPHILKFLDL